MRAIFPLLLLTLAGCGSTPTADAPTPASADLRSLVDTDGQPQDLDAALGRGETVALVFWQTWCETCGREAPAIAEAARRHGEAIRFVGVVPGRDETVDDAEVARVRAAWGYAFPQVRDRDMTLTRALGVDGTPTIVVLGPGRAALYRGHRPPEDWTPLRGAPLADQGCPGGVCPLPE